MNVSKGDFGKRELRKVVGSSIKPTAVIGGNGKVVPLYQGMEQQSLGKKRQATGLIKNAIEVSCVIENVTSNGVRVTGIPFLDVDSCTKDNPITIRLNFVIDEKQAISLFCWVVWQRFFLKKGKGERHTLHTGLLIDGGVTDDLLPYRKFVMIQEQIYKSPKPFL